MPHRDDLEAAHARIAALERELVTARKEGRPRLRCSRCHAAIGDGDLDKKSGRVTCPACRARVDAGRPAAATADLEVSETPERLLIAWKWRLSAGALLAALVFLGFPIIVGIAADDLPGAVVFSMIVIGLLGLAAAVRVAAQIANRTEIRVTDRELAIETGPVSIDPRKSWTRGEIKQLYCVMQKGKYVVWYLLAAELTNGTRVDLVDEIDQAERAFFLEREIERRLAIEDQPVEGEVARRSI